MENSDDISLDMADKSRVLRPHSNAFAGLPFHILFSHHVIICKLLHASIALLLSAFGQIVRTIPFMRTIPGAIAMPTKPSAIATAPTSSFVTSDGANM